MFGFRLSMESEEASFMPIFLKRAYEKSKADDGKRILVERLWPGTEKRGCENR
jgi:uncharacterized protein YeaO (DUF488 family)